MPTPAAHSSLQLHPQGPLPSMDLVSAVARPDPFDDPEWMFEPKYDGIRGLIYATGGSVEIRARQETRLVRWGELGERIAGVLRGRSAILDGEVVSLDRQGKPNFRDLIRGEGFLAFAAFDLLWLDGEDLRGRPLVDRKRMLIGLLPEDTGPLYKVLTLDEYGRALFSAVRKMDLAGMVAKRKGDAYGPGATWYQIANPAHVQGDRRLRQRPAAVSDRRSASEAARRG